MKILRMSDRIKLWCEEFTAKISPLDHAVQVEIMGDMPQIKRAALIIKHSVKELTGLECHDGSKYELKFENGCLTDDCAQEVTNALMRTKLPAAVVHAANGNFEHIQGVQFEIVPN